MCTLPQPPSTALLRPFAPSDICWANSWSWYPVIARSGQQAKYMCRSKRDLIAKSRISTPCLLAAAYLPLILTLVFVVLDPTDLGAFFSSQSQALRVSWRGGRSALRWPIRCGDLFLALAFRVITWCGLFLASPFQKLFNVSVSPDN